MISSRIRVGVRAGFVAAAATAGAIIGFGLRHNDWLGPFASLGAAVTAGFGLVNPPHLLASTAGVTAHLAWMVIWGIAFAALAYRKTTPSSALFAVLVAIGAALAARYLVPAALGAVSFAGMPAAQAVLCVALMSAGFVTGLALSRAH